MKLFQKNRTTKNFKTKSSFIDFVTGGGDNISLSSSYPSLVTTGYIKNPIVYRCVNRLASACSNVPLKLYKYNNDGSKTEIKSHEILDLIYNPNPLSSYNSLIKEFFVSKFISGEGFIKATETGNRLLELWVIKPDQVTVNYDAKADKVEYLISNRTYNAYGKDGYKCQVFQFKNDNPLAALRGLSPMLSCSEAIVAFNESVSWNKFLVRNGANPSGALKVPKETKLTDEQFEQLKSQLESEYSGAANSGKPILLEGGIDWQQFGLSPKDMDFNNSLLEMARFICTSYGVPSQLIGIRGESTYSNYSHALLAFWQDTVVPEMNEFAASFSIWLQKWYKDNTLFLEIDLQNIDALEPRKKERADRVSVSSNYLKINEARSILGLDDIDEGDVILIDPNKVPLGEEQNDDEEDIAATAEQDYLQSIADVEAEKNKS